MPLYEYKCHSCGEVFEVLQKFSDEPLTVHGECRGPVERLISPSALRFKGSGFYITDYAPGSKAGGGKNGKDSPAAKEASKNSENTLKKKESSSTTDSSSSEKK